MEYKQAVEKIRMKINLIMLAVCFVAAGCAGAFHLSEEAAAYSASLGRNDALDVAKKFLAPSERQRGICSTIKNTVEPNTLTINGPIVSYVEHVTRPLSTSVSGSVGGGSGVISTTVIKEKVRYSFDITKLEKIRLIRFNTEYPFGICAKGLPGTLVTLIDNANFRGFHGVEFHVATENMDPLLAALKRLSPNVEITGTL